MSDPDYEAHYKPPESALDGHAAGAAAATTAGPLRVLWAAVAGFLVDVIGTQLLGTVLAVVQAILAPASEPPFMDFSNWMQSFANPWTVASFAMGTLMSVLAGWLAVGIARGRAWPAYIVLLVLYLGYSLWQQLSSGESDVDWATFTQVLSLNLLAPGVGVWLRARRGRKTN